MTSLPGGQVPILIINPLPTEAVIHKGTNVATAIPFDEMMVAPVREDSNVYQQNLKSRHVSVVCCMIWLIEVLVT